MNTTKAKIPWEKSIALTVTPNDKFLARGPGGNLNDRVDFLTDVLSGYFQRMGKGYRIKGVFELGEQLRLHFHSTIWFKTERAYYTFMKSVIGSISYNIGFVLVKAQVNDGWTITYLDKDYHSMLKLGVKPLNESDFFARYVQKIRETKSAKVKATAQAVTGPLIDWAKQLLQAAQRPPNTYEDESI